MDRRRDRSLGDSWGHLRGLEPWRVREGVAVRRTGRARPTAWGGEATVTADRSHDRDRRSSSALLLGTPLEDVIHKDFAILWFVSFGLLEFVRGAEAPIRKSATTTRSGRSIPQDVKIAVSVRDGGRCRRCGSDRDLQYDHIVPYSRGGSSDVDNIQLLCGRCNRRKSNW